MKKIRTLLLSLVFSLLSVVQLHAVPASPSPMKFTQPSGEFFWGRKIGDEHYSYSRTLSGYGVYKNALGQWAYYRDNGTSAFSPALGSVNEAIVGLQDPVKEGLVKGLWPKRSFSTLNKSIGLNQMTINHTIADPKSGTVPLLIILVDFANRAGTYTSAEFDPNFFGGEGSVADYYNKVSYGAFNYAPVNETSGVANDGMVGWVRLAMNHPNVGKNLTPKIQGDLVGGALIGADSFVDYSKYDTNGDGKISTFELSLILIVAGFEASAGNQTPNIWAHKSEISEAYRPTLDGVELKSYCLFGEIQRTNKATMGVMAHELGHHTLELPDLYDTSGGPGGIGGFGLMASGSWGNKTGELGGTTPTHVCAWTREHLGWGSITTVSSDQQVTLAKVDSNENSLVRVYTSDPDEYFLIENRQPTGYDAGFASRSNFREFTNGGIAVYHVDDGILRERLPYNAVNWLGAKGVDIEEANESEFGVSMQEAGVQIDTGMFYFQGNFTTFDDSSIPSSKLKSGASTGVSITNVSAPGDTMTFNIALGEISVPEGAHVTNVSSSNNSGSYTTGSVLSITVEFSEAVTVDTAGGAPTLTLETGSSDQTISYDGGSGGTTLSFSYTVRASDKSSDLSYISSAALQLSGSSILDGDDNDVSIALPQPGSSGSLSFNKDILINDNSPPPNSIPKVTINLSETSVKEGESILVTVTVSDDDAGDVLVTTLIVDGQLVDLVGTGDTKLFVYEAGEIGEILFQAMVSDTVDTATASAALTVNPNTPPVVSVKLSSDLVEVNTPVTITLSFSDVDGDELFPNMLINGKSVTSLLVGSGGSRSYVYTPTSGGVVRIHAFVYDGTDTSSETVFLTVKPGVSFVIKPASGEIEEGDDIAIYMTVTGPAVFESLVPSMTIDGVEVKLTGESPTWVHTLVKNTAGTYSVVGTIVNGPFTSTSTTSFKVITPSPTFVPNDSGLSSAVRAVVDGMNTDLSDEGGNSRLCSLMNVTSSQDLSSAMAQFAATVKKGQTRRFECDGELFVTVVNTLTAGELIVHQDSQYPSILSGVPANHTLVIATIPLTQEVQAPSGSLGKVLAFHLMDSKQEVESGFDIDITFPSFRNILSDTAEPILYEQSETKGSFSKSSFSLKESGQDLKTSLNHFSVYVIVNEESKAVIDKEASKGAGRTAGGGCFLR